MYLAQNVEGNKSSVQFIIKEYQFKNDIYKTCLQGKFCIYFNHKMKETHFKYINTIFGFSRTALQSNIFFKFITNRVEEIIRVLLMVYALV
jgi:hypothetical protein